MGPSPYDVQFQFYPDVVKNDAHLREQVYFGQAREMFHPHPRESQIHPFYPPKQEARQEYPGPSNYIDADTKVKEQYNHEFSKQDDRVHNPDYQVDLVQEPYYPYPAYAVDPYHYIYDPSTTQPPPTTSTTTTAKPSRHSPEFQGKGLHYHSPIHFIS